MAIQEKTIEAIPLCGRVLGLSPRGVLGLGVLEPWSLGRCGDVECLVGPV
jgi:hypothetical protein